MNEPIRFVRGPRCQLSLRVRVKSGNPDARLMRYAESGEGLCASCAAALFLHSIPHIKQAIDGKREMLVWEALHTQCAALMQAGQADARPTEIRWQHVLDCSHLPFPVPRRTRHPAQVRADEPDHPTLWENDHDQDQ